MPPFAYLGISAQVRAEFNVQMYHRSIRLYEIERLPFYAVKYICIISIDEQL